MIKRQLVLSLVIVVCLLGCTKNQYRNEELTNDPYTGIRFPLYFDLLDYAPSFGILKVISQVDAVYMESFYPGYTIELHSGSGFFADIVPNEYEFFAIGLSTGEAVECRIYNSNHELVFTKDFAPD